MAMMSRYCCAYPAERLRAFPSWSENVPPLRAGGDEDAVEGGDAAAPEAEDGEDVEYFFLHDNYVVTAGMWIDEQIAFDAVTDEWKRFCADELAFAVPALDAAESAS